MEFWTNSAINQTLKTKKETKVLKNYFMAQDAVYIPKEDPYLFEIDLEININNYQFKIKLFQYDVKTSSKEIFCKIQIFVPNFDQVAYSFKEMRYGIDLLNADQTTDFLYWCVSKCLSCINEKQAA